MSVEPTTPATGVADVGDAWDIGVEIRTDDNDFIGDAGDLTDATVAVTVTLPNLSTVPLAVVHDGPGRYSAGYVLPAAGRYFAVAAVSGAAVGVATFAVECVAPNAVPTVENVRSYLGESGGKYDAEELAETLDAEIEDQAEVCRVDATWPAWRRRAVLRRVARALALKALPTAMPQGDAQLGPQFLPREDPEVRRLEGPHRKVVFG